jgi:signal transduction histidine kinase
METAHFLQKDSIATQLIKIVFALYCVVAIFITTTQILLEYNHTKTQIRNELSINEQIFEPVLAVGLWNLDDEQIQSTLQGMLSIPIITGVKIEQDGQLLKAVGVIKKQDNVIMRYNNQGVPNDINLPNSSEIFSYSFAINYSFRDQPREVGVATVYSDSSAVLARVEMGLMLLIINSIIKTIALWALFFYVGRRILLRPLYKLINAIQSVDFNTLGKFEVKLQSQRKNELTVLQDSFSSMLNQLADARNKIVNLNNNLEYTVEKRTLDLKMAKEEAELANHSKSIFLSRINHELRTPLNAILGCSQILHKQLSGPKYEAQRQMVDHTVQAGEHLLMLFEDIMTIVVMNGSDVTIELDTFDLNKVINASITMVHTLAKDKNITIDANSVPLKVYANANRLRQVLINLLSNAIKYNHNDGNVTITTGIFEKNRVMIMVKDNGIGIASKDMGKIFEPLHRLTYAQDNSIEGTGLGLSIVRSLTFKMNGTINVDSKLGVGSEFIITLPINKE